MPSPAVVEMLFVHPEHLRVALAKLLWECARAEIARAYPAVKTIELNSTPYALGSAASSKPARQSSRLERGVFMEMTVVLARAEEGGLVVSNPETGTTTQGETVEAALANLQEAAALYLEEFPLSSLSDPCRAEGR